MANIGSFKPTKTGYEGTIATLHLNKKVKFIANEDKKSDESPDYFIKAGTIDFGAAWKEIKEGDEPLKYLSVKLDCPTFTKPINAALFDNDDGADLVWSRTKKQ